MAFSDIQISVTNSNMLHYLSKSGNTFNGTEIVENVYVWLVGLRRPVAER